MKKRKLVFLSLIILATICLLIGVTACGDSSKSSGKQVPVYQGMVISSARNSTSSVSYVSDESAFLSTDLSDNISGDIYDDTRDIDSLKPFGDNSSSIDDKIEEEFGIDGSRDHVYYANPNEDIYINVKFSNPDNYEILSFRINGQTFASYMFEYGSDMENIIVKVNVGSVGGFIEYTIDEIKYVDGTNIKNALLNGDTSVRCGVRTDEIPNVTISNETTDLVSISFNVKLSDSHDLIDNSNGYAVAVLYDGFNIIDTANVVKGENEITFLYLTPNTLYQYAIVAFYDNMSGDGFAANILYSKALYTDAMVLFDNVKVSKTGVSFDFAWYEGYDDSYLHTKFTLESSDGAILNLIEPELREITGLLSNTEYTLNVAYTGVYGKTESIRLTFKTLSMEMPEVEIESLSASKSGIEYVILITDIDKTGEIESIDLLENGDKINSSTSLSGVFDGLYSGSEYTLVVTYVYDLNDGFGTRKMEISTEISTLTVPTPEVELNLLATKDAVDYKLDVVDDDDTIVDISISLIKDTDVVYSTSQLEGKFSGLLSDNEYTIKIEYTYNLNDGRGIQTSVIETNTSTLAKEIPVVEIVYIDGGASELTFVVLFSDNDDVGAITNVCLYEGGALVSETGNAFTGEITYYNLSSYTLYSLIVSYEYDLNDGLGPKTETVEFSCLTDPLIEVETVSVINADTITVGDTVTVEIKLSNPDGVNFDSVVINGKNYSVLETSSSTSLFVDLVVDDLIDGGSKEFTVSKLIGSLDEFTYEADIDTNNTTTIFVYGEIFIDNLSLARYTKNRMEETKYRFLDEQIYYKISLRNGTSYEIYSVTIDGTTYTGDDITMTDDRQTVYVSTKSVSKAGWNTEKFTQITYGSDYYGERGKSSDISLAYVTLNSSEQVYEIDTVEDLLNMDMSGYNYYKLTSNIDLSGYGCINLGTMYGVFDGNGYRISNFGIEAEYSETNLYLGLFKEVKGIVMNLDLCDMNYDVTLSGPSTTYTIYAGALAAEASYMIVENCNISSSFSISTETSGAVYIGALSGHGSSGGGLYYYNVITEMSASIVCNKYIYCSGFTGSGLSFFEYDCTCTVKLSENDTEIEYISVGDYKFSHEGDAYFLIEYFGSDTSLVLPDSINGHTYGIGDYTFASSKIEEVIIPNGVTSIGYNSFGYCSCLTSIVIPESITSIDSFAFSVCNYVEEIYFNATALDDLSSYNYVFDRIGQLGNGVTVTIGSNVTKIPAYLFCASNSSVYAPNIKSVVFEDGSQCKSIGEYAFCYCSSLESITIPESVTSIGNYAFSECTAIERIYFNAESMEDLQENNYAFRYAGQNGNGITLTIGASVMEIPAYLFCPYYSYSGTSSYAPNITNVIFDDNSKCSCIGSYAFFCCTSMTGVYITDLVSWCLTEFNGLYSNPLYNAANLYLNNELIIDLVIPYTVNSIEKYTFAGCTSIENVSLGTRITNIGNCAFYNCTSLTSIIIPDSVSSIGSDAFYGCTSLLCLTIGTGVTSIGSSAFRECTALEEVYFNAKEMDDLAQKMNVFSKAGQSGDGIIVNIGKEVTRIPAYLFNPYESGTTYTPKIKIVVFDTNCKCTSIGDYAFAYCTYLTDVIISNCVTKIGEWAFYKSTAIQNIVIPKSLNSIGMYAFYGCNAIESVFYLGTSSEWSSISISFNNDYLTRASRYYYSETKPTSSGNYWYYDDEGYPVKW